MKKIDLKLLEELEYFEQKGVSIWLDEKPSYSFEVLKALSVKEENNYMKDYVPNEKGEIKELRFNNIKHVTGSL